MGYILSTLKNLSKYLDYYFFLVGDYSNTTLINKFFSDDFDTIGNRLHETSGIIKKASNSKIEKELTEAIQRLPFRGTEISNFIDSIVSQCPGLLIIKKHPDDLTEKDKILHIPFSTLKGVYTDDTQALLDDLVNFSLGQNQLIDKVVKWTKYEKRKILSGFSIGVNIGFIAINYNFK